jgi:hypothetical protein
MLNNHIVKQVNELKPGEAIKFNRHYLNSHVPSFHHKGAKFTAADRVLENIMGSAYEYRYDECHMNGDITFFRLEKPLENGRKSYTSPDRR